MTKQTIVTLLAAVLVTSLIGLLIGYKWGRSVVVVDSNKEKKSYYLGRKEGHASGAVNANIANCVFLFGAIRLEDSGESIQARELHYRSFYSSAIELDVALQAGELPSDLSLKVRGILEDVVSHYWGYPDSISFLEREQWLKPSHEATLHALFNRYKKPAEQGAAGNPLPAE